MRPAQCCASCGAVATSTCSTCAIAPYCSHACHVADWRHHKLTCSAKVHVARVAGKGVGLIALLDFAIGDELVREKPLVVLPGAECAGQPADSARGAIARGAETAAALALLPEAQHAAAMALLDAWHPGAPTPLGIARTNAVPLSTARGGSSRRSALFALTCRINHACKANALYVWRDDLERELVFAMRPIAAGEEITVSYHQRYAPIAARKAALAAGFNFDCCCTACAEHSAAPADQATSDARMRELQDTIDAVPRVGYRDQAGALAMCERVLQLMSAEGLDTPVDTGCIHYDAFQMARAIGDSERARAHIDAACVCAAQCEGASSALTREYAAVAHKLGRSGEGPVRRLPSPCW